MTEQKSPKVITIEMPSKKNRQTITVDAVMEEFWYIVKEKKRKVRVSEIAERLGCTKPPVAKQLKRAVDQGKVSQEVLDANIDTRTLSRVHALSKDTKDEILKELESFYMNKRSAVRIEDYYKHSEFSIEDINVVVNGLSLNDRYFFFGDSLALKKKKEHTAKYTPSGKQLAVKEVSMDKIITKRLPLNHDLVQNFLRNFAGEYSKKYIHALYREGA